MTGEVIKKPTDWHICAPGWRYEPFPEGHALAPGNYGIPPASWAFPKGTVWRCTCGQVWVSTGSLDEYSPGTCGWRREGRWERWLRERREAR